MGKLTASTSFGLGSSKTTDTVFPKNHFSSKEKLPPEVLQKVASMNLTRVAGNIWECPSTREFWKVNGGKIIRLTVDEVDNGESMAAAPPDNPASFLTDILGDLTF